jgi:hypothetical protein
MLSKKALKDVLIVSAVVVTVMIATLVFALDCVGAI